MLLWLVWIDLEVDAAYTPFINLVLAGPCRPIVDTKLRTCNRVAVDLQLIALNAPIVDFKLRTSC